jgi:hypothetical protein
VRVYRYGCAMRSELPMAAEEQLRLAHDFWNTLVEIHHKYAARRLEVANGASEAVAVLVARRAEIDARLTELRERIRGARKAARSDVPVSSFREEVGRLRDERRAVAAELRAAREEARDAVAPALHELAQAEQREVKAARQEYAGRGLYWGSYNATLQGFDAARNRRAADGRPSEVRFHRWDGTGTWTVQIQRQAGEAPLTWADVCRGIEPKLQVRMPDEEWEVVVDGATGAPKIGGNGEPVRRRRLPVVRMQIRGERAKGPEGAVKLEPAWLEVPFVLHREPPADARIAMAQIVRTRVAGHWSYGFCLTVDEGPVVPLRDGPAVAVDVGWRRKRDGGLRVAFWVGSDGAKGEVLCPVDTEIELMKASELRSLRDEKFNVARERLGAWIAGAAVPDWLRDATSTLREWRSQQRLAALALRWRGQRFDGDQQAYDALGAWRRQDRHLWEWEANVRQQAEARRRDAYRRLAHDLAERYAVLIVEDMRLPDVQRRPAPEDGPAGEGRVQRNTARIAAPGFLRQAIAQAAPWRGAVYRQADAKLTTRVHHACGQRVDVDYAADVEVYCPFCRAWYDQDENAAWNLLARASGEVTQEERESLAKRPEHGQRGRWARRKASGE